MQTMSVVKGPLIAIIMMPGGAAVQHSADSYARHCLYPCMVGCVMDTRDADW